MIWKIIGGLSFVLGLFMFIWGPGDRAQIASFGNTARILGIIMIGAGILMLKV